MKITSNAASLAAKFRRRIKKINAALYKGLRRAAIKVDNAQVKNLIGGEKPGDYPVPVRSGNLLQGHFFKVVSSRFAVVGNSASYALPVHEGKGSSAVYGKRPFLDDAVESVDVQGEVRSELKKVMFAL